MGSLSVGPVHLGFTLEKVGTAPTEGRGNPYVTVGCILGVLSVSVGFCFFYFILMSLDSCSDIGHITPTMPETSPGLSEM